MSKKPDLGKFNFSKIMSNIAEVVDSGSKIKDVDPSDAIGKKIEEIDNTVQEMHKAHQEHTNNLARVDQLLKDLFQDLQALRAEFDANKPEPEASSQDDAQEQEASSSSDEVGDSKGDGEEAAKDKDEKSD